MGHKILVIDDQADVVIRLAAQLEERGFQVVAIEDAETALARTRVEMPALILLDLMLPHPAGLEICREIKRDPVTAHIPIIILTARADEVDKIVGLELGADDFVTKPFNFRELLLRINCSLRRLDQVMGAEKMVVGELVLDRIRHEIRVKGTAIGLTATEFRLLTVFMERRGKVQNRDMLLNDVWGSESVIDAHTVDTHVRRLREKLGPLSGYIETIRGVGYRMNAGDETARGVVHATA